MNAKELLNTIQTAKGKAYIEAIALSQKPQFRSITNSISGFWPCPKRYFQAFQETCQTFKVNRIKPLQICEENIEKLLLPFASKDNLRPHLQSFFVDGNNIVSTDCHKLAILPNFTHLKEGIYQFNKLVKEPTTEKYIPYNGNRYVDYNAVIPKQNFTAEKIVNLSETRQILSAAKKYKLYDFTENPAKRVKFCVGSELYAVNGDFLLNVVTLFTQLNCETAIVNFSGPSKVIVFSWGRIKILLMPVINEGVDENSEIIDLTECFYEG